MKRFDYWRIPENIKQEIRDEFRKKNYLWIISQFNEYMVSGADKLCSTCPESIDYVKKHCPSLYADLD